MSIVDHNKQLKWPNKILPIAESSSSYISNTNHIYQKKNSNTTATNILVADGFLVPGKDQGEIFILHKKELEWWNRKKQFPHLHPIRGFIMSSMD
jgi:hypothetical protein